MPDTTKPEFRSASLVLRRPREQDIDALLALPLDLDAMLMFGVDATADTLRTLDQARAEYRKLEQDPLVWVIDAGDGYIGHINLHDLNQQDRRAKLAIWIEDASRRNQGVGTQAIKLILTHAFDTLRLHRVGIRVLDINTRAIRAYEKCGFVQEGLERETACIRGHWHDDIMMGLLEREFRTAIKTT
jgi:RimJ/RimL family protein N-acetyltransferase